MASEYDNKIKELQEHLPALDKILHDARNRKDKLDCSKLEKLRGIVLKKIPVSMEILKKSEFAIKRIIKDKQKHKKTVAAPIIPKCAVDRSSAPGIQASRSDPISDIKIKIETKSPDDDDDDDVQIVKSSDADAIIVLDSDESDDDENRKNTSPSSNAEISKEASKILSTKNAIECHSKEIVKVKKEEVDVATNSSTDRLRGNEGEPKSITERTEAAINPAEGCQSEPLIAPQTTFDSSKDVVSSNVLKEQVEPTSIAKTTEVISSAKGCQSDPVTVSAPPQVTFDPSKVVESRGILKELESQLKQLNSGNQFPMSLNDTREDVDMELLLSPLKSLLVNTSKTEEINIQEIESKCDDNMEPAESSITLPFPLPNFSNKSSEDLINEETSTQSGEVVKAKIATDEVIKSTCSSEAKNTNVPAATSKVPDQVIESSVENESSNKSTSCTSTSSHVPIGSQELDLTTKANNRLAEIIASLQKNLVSDTEEKEQEVAKKPENLFVNKIQLTELPSIVQDMLTTNEPTDPEDEEFKLVIDESESVVEAVTDRALPSDIDEMTGLDAERNKDVFLPFSSTSQIPADVLDSDDSLDREINEAIAELSGKNFSELNSAATMDDIELDDELSCDIKVPEISSKCDSESKQSVSVCNESKNADVDDSQVTKLIDEIEEKERENSVAMQTTSANMPAAGSNETENVDQLNEKTPELQDVTENANSSLEQLSKIEKYFKSNTIPSINKISDEMPCAQLNVEQRDNMLNISHESLLDELHLRIEESDEEETDAFYSGTTITNESEKISSSSEQPTQPPTSVNVSSKQTTTENIQADDSTTSECIEGRQAVESAEKESEKTDLVKVDNCAELTLKANNLLQDCKIPHTNVTTTADSSSNETQAAGAESVIEGSETEPPISRRAVESAEKESEKTDLVKVDNRAELTLKANNLLQDCNIPHTNVTTTADSSSNETRAAGAESLIEGSETEPPISRRAVESAEKESEKTDLVKVDNRAELTLKANNLLQDTNVMTTADSSSNETRAAGAESVIEGSETEPPISRPSGSKVEEISSATLLLSAQSTPNKMKEPQVKADPVKLPNETQSSSSKVAENGSVEIRSETQLTATMSPSVSKSPEPEIAPSNSLKVNISGAPVNTDAKNDIYPRKEKPNQTEMTKNHENAEPSTSKEPNITTETTKVMNAVHRDDLEFLMLQKRKIELERELILLKSNKKDQIPSDKLNSEVPDNLSDISADSDCVSLSFSDLSDVEPGEIIERPHMPKPLVKEEPNNFAFQESLKVTILNRNNPFDLRHQLIAKSQRECRLHDTTLSLPVPADISKCKKRKERRRRKHGFVVDEFDPSVNVKAELPIVPAHSKYVYRRSTSTDCSAKRFISLDVKAEFPAGSSTDMRHNFEHNNEKLPGFDKVGQGYAQQAVKREVAHQSSRSPEQYPEHNRSASGSLVSSPSSRPFDGKIRRSRSPNPFKEASTSQRLMSSRSPERHPEFNRPPLGSLVSPSSIRPFGAKIRRSRSPNPFREVSTAQKEHEKPLFRRSCSPKPSGEASTSQREHQKPPIGLSRSPKMFPEASTSTSQRELQKPPEPRSRSPRRRSRSPRRHSRSPRRRSRSPLHLMKITKREPDRRSRSPRRSPVEIMKITKRSPDRPSRSPRRSPVHLMKITKRSPGRRSRSPRRSPVRLMKISKRSPDRRSRSPRRSPVRLMKISKRSPDRPSRSPKRRSISPKLRRLSRSPKRSPKNLRRSLSPPRVRRSSRSPRRSPRRLSPRRRSQSPRRCVARSPRRSPRRLSRSPKRSPRRLSRSPRRSPRRLSKSPRRSPRRLSRSPRRSSRSPRRSPRRLSRSPRRSPRRLSRSPRRSPRRLSRSPGHSRSSRSPRRSSRRLSRSPRRSPRRLSRSPKRSPRRLSRSPRRRSRSPRRSPRRLSRSPRRSPSWLPRSPRRSRSPRGSSRRHSSRSPRRLSRSPKRSPRSRSPRRSPSQSSSYIGRALSRSPVRIENLKPSLSDRSSQSPIRFVNVTNADEQILAKNKDPLRPNTSANKTVSDTIRCSENLQAPAAASVVSTSQPIAIIDLSDSGEEVTLANSNDSSANNNNANLCDTLTIEVSDDEESILEPPPPPKISAEDIQLSPTNNVNDNDGQVICLDDDEPLQKSSNKDTACVKVVEPQFSDNSNDSNGAQQGPSTSAELLEEKDLRELNDIKEELEQRLGIDAEVISQLVKSALNKANANDSASATTAPERQTQSGMTLILSTERLQAPVMAHVSPKDPRLNRLQPPKPIPAPSTEPPPPPMIPRLTPAVALPQSSPTRKSAVSSDEYSDNDDFSTESGSSSDEFTKSLKPNAEFITLEVSKLQEIIDEQIKKYLAQNKEQHEAVLKKTTPTSKSGTKDSGAVRESSKSRPLRNACSKDGSGPRHMTAEKIVSDIKKSMASLCGTPTPSTSTSAPSETPRRKRGRPRKKTAVLSSSESDAENIPVPSPPSLSDKETAVNLSGGTDKTPSDRSETPLPRRGRGGSRRRNLVVSSSESDAENVVTPSSKTLASKESADSLRLRITEDLTDIIKLGKSAKVKPSPALKRAEQTNLLTPLKEVPYNDKRQKSTEAHQSKKQKRVPKNIDTSMNCKSDATNCLLCKDKSKGLELISHYVNDHRENEVFTARLVTEQIKALKARPNYMHLSKNSSNIEKYTGKCPICDEAMTCTIGRFMEHLASHTGEFAYECDCCGIRDSRKRDLLKHCNKECEKGAKFIYVYRYDLSNKVIEAFVCGICNYIQLNRANVIKHLRTEHETQLLSSEDFVTVTLFQVGDEPSNEAVSEPVPDNIEVVDEAFAYDEDDTDNFEDIPGSPMGDTAGQGDDVVECVKNEFLQDVIDDFDWKAICDTLEDPDENLYEALKPEVTVEEVQANKDEKPTPDIGTQIFTEVHSMSLNGPGIEKDNRGATGQATTSDDINLSAANSSSNSQPSKKQKKSNQIKDTSKLLKVENIGVEEVSSDLLKFHCLTKNCNVEPFENLDDLRKHLKKHRSNWSGFCFACKKQVIPRFRQLDKELAHFIEKHLPKKSLTAEVLCPWIANDPRQCQKTEDVCKMLLTNFALENLYKCMGPDCVYTINSAKEMESHLAMNHANDPTALNCSYCKDSFPHRNALVDHIGQVHGSSNYQCSQCFYRSCAAYNVQMHQRTFHKNQEDVSVIVCAGQSHTFTTDILEILEYRLKNVQPIKCPFFSACRKNMYAKHLVLDHIRRDHSQKEAVDIASKTYDCMYCSYGADDLLSIRQHMANEHPDRLLYVCGRVFMKSLHLMIGQDDFDIASIKKTTCLVYIGGSVSKNRLRLTEEVTYASDSIQAVNMGEDPGALNARIRKWFGEAATHFEEVETYLQRIAAGASPDTMNNDEELELNELVMAVIKNTGFVGKQLYRCGFPMCTHSCENFDKFDRHLNGHRGDKKEPIYRCPHCNVIVATNQIRLHTLKHRRHRYLCYFCGESSESQNIAIDHLKSEHQSQGIVFVYITSDKESSPGGAEMESRIFVSKPRKISNDDDVAEVMRVVLKKRLDASGSSLAPKDVSKQERPESPVDRKEETTIPVFVSLDTRLTCNMDDCPFVAKTEPNLLMHIAERHRVMQKGKYECPHCSYVMPPTLRLNINRICNHLKYHGRNIVLCNVCNYYHHNRLRVLEHMSMCHPFNFATCTVHTRSTDGTKTKLEILYNKNVRSPDDSYKCTLCDATLTECDDFFIHMKELHLLNVRFVCDTCNFFENTLQAVEIHAKQKHPEGGKVRVRSVFLPAGGKWVQNLSPFTLLVESGGPAPDQSEDGPTSSRGISPQPSSSSKQNEQICNNKRKFEDADTAGSKKDSKKSRISGGSKRPADEKQSDENTKRARLSPVIDHEKSDVSSSQLKPNEEGSKSSDKSATLLAAPSATPSAHVEPATGIQVEVKPKPFLKLVPVEKLLRSDIQNGVVQNNHQIPPLQAQQWHEQPRDQLPTSDHQQPAPQTPNQLVEYPKVDVFLICFYCNARTNNFTTLHSHCREKHGGDSVHFTVSRRLLCAYCPMMLPYNDMKIHHMQYHPNHAFGTRSAALHFICGECPTVFKNKHEIEDHFKIAHSNLHLQKTPSFAYLTQPFLDDLLKIENNSGVEVNKCPCCDRIYLQYEPCQTHIEQTHSEAFGQTPNCKAYNNLLYGCYKCRVLFETETRAIHHMRKHVSPYGCKYCEMTFEVHNALVDHHRLFHKTVETTYRIQKNAETEEKFMSMLVRFPNGLILTRLQLENTDYGQREQYMQMIESREKAELQEWISRQERSQQIESIARIKIEIEQEASLFQSPSAGDDDTL